MKKVVFVIFIILVIVGVIIGGYVIYQEQNKRQSQESTEISIQNSKNQEIETEKQLENEKKYSQSKGGHFAKVGNIIIYVDFDNNIYKIDTKEKIGRKLYTPEKGINFMYFDGEFIYYMPYYYRGRGIYKLSLDGKVEKIFEGASLQLLITEEKIYFTNQKGFDDMNQNPQGDLCVMNKDGSEVVTLIPNVRNHFKINQDKIYYTDNNTKGVFVADLDGQNRQHLASGRTSILSLNNDSLTYVDFNDGEAINLINLHDNSRKTLGRFGGSVATEENEIYAYTRKVYEKTKSDGSEKVMDLDENRVIENAMTFMKIDSENNLEELWKSEQVTSASYIYHNYMYVYGNGETQRINLDSKETEKMDFGSSSYLNGTSYSIMGNTTYLRITNLDTLEKEDIPIEA